MTHKKAVKLLMSLSFNRNEANEYLNANRNPGYTNENRVYGAWFVAFKKSRHRGDYRIET